MGAIDSKCEKEAASSTAETRSILQTEDMTDIDGDAEFITEYEFVEWRPVEEVVHRLTPVGKNIHFGCQHEIDTWSVDDPKLRKKLEDKRLAHYPANYRKQFRIIWDALRMNPAIPYFQELQMLNDSYFQFKVQVNGEIPIYYRGYITRHNTVELYVYHHRY